MGIAEDAARLRLAAEVKPLKLPINRRIDERHHHVTTDGLSIWYTIQVAPHSRIQEAVFERADRPPTDDEIGEWLYYLLPRTWHEISGVPGSMTRRFEAFDRDPEREAPLA